MEELALNLIAEGIQKKVTSPGKGELSTFTDGTKASFFQDQLLLNYISSYARYNFKAKLVIDALASIV